MKRTCLQRNTNINEQIACEFPARRSGGHRVRKWIKETKYNRQLISNFNNLYIEIIMKNSKFILREHSSECYYLELL